MVEARKLKKQIPTLTEMESQALRSAIYRRHFTLYNEIETDKREGFLDEGSQDRIAQLAALEVVSEKLGLAMSFTG